MSAYVKLPKNIKFSEIRRHGPKEDAFDILVDGKVAHTYTYDTSTIQGNTSEAFVIAQAHIEAKDWLRHQHLLPVGE